MRVQPLSRTTAVILASALGAVSCGGDSGPTDRGTATTSRSPSFSSADALQSAAAFSKADGMVLLGCPANLYVVLDPQTGEVGGDLYANVLLASGELETGPLDVIGDFCAEPGTLSPDRRKLAMSGKPSGDGSTHVGWLDLTTGQQTDVTAASVGTDFAASTPEDSNPRFGRDGRFYFKRFGVIPPLVADDAGRVTEADRAVACTAQATCGPLTHPSGKFVADDKLARDHLLVGSTDPTAGPNDNSAYGIEIPLTVQGQPWEPMRPRYWIDDRSLMCESTNHEFRVVTIDPAELPLGTTQDVELAAREVGPLAVPKTDRDILWTAPTPDRRSLLFAASRGVEAPLLYRVDLTAAAEPEELGPVPDGLDGDSAIWGRGPT